MNTKLRSTCEKYARIKVSYKYQETVKEFSKYQNIVITKQDKGRGVVIMGKSKYHVKCLMILENSDFKTLDHDPTKKTKRKYTTNFTENEKEIITTKILMFITKWILSRQVENDTDDEHPVRPIVPNIGTATCNLARYLAKLLPPLIHNKEQKTICRTNSYETSNG